MARGIRIRGVLRSCLLGLIIGLVAGSALKLDLTTVFA